MPSGSTPVARPGGPLFGILVTATLALAACSESTPTVPTDEQPDNSIRRLVIEPRDISIHVDDSVVFRAYGLTASGDTTEVQVTWSTTSGSLKTTNGGKGNGQVQYKGKNPGRDDVVATDTSGVADTTHVSVTEETVARVEVAPAEASLTVGGTLQLTATGLDENGNVLEGRLASWTTSDPSVATVSASGLVTALSVGAVSISATMEGRKAASSITVTAPSGSGALVVRDSPGGPVASSIDFGSARAGTDLPWRTLYLVNEGAASVRELSFTYHDPVDSRSVHFADYQYPGTGGTCERSLAPGATCTLVVQFSPMSSGPLAGEFRAEYVGGEGSANVRLFEVRGNGTGTTIYAHSDASLREGIGQLAAGVTLILEDGMYGDVEIDGVSGAASSPAIVRSRNDGGAHLRTLDVSYVSNLHLVGLQAGLGRNEISGGVIDIKAAERLLLKRVTAHHAEEAGNNHVIEISESRYVTLEDCAAWGSGRIQILYYDSELGIFRRVWGQHLHNESDTWPRTVLALYYGASSLVENSVATQALDADPGVGQIEGFKVNSRSGKRIPDNNTLRGNAAYGLQGPAYYTTGDYDFVNTHFYDNVAVGPADHYLDSAFDPDDQASGTVVRRHTSSHTIIAIGNPGSSSGGDGISGSMKNSIFSTIDRSGPIESVAWSLFQDVGDLSSSLTDNNRRITDLGFDEAGFGRVGAYLIRPPSARGSGEGGADSGAEVLFRYAETDNPTPTDREGTLTAIPLWPHPLEERVWRESGNKISITYESRDGRSGLGGIFRDREALRRAYLGR